jgi:hypothetical protein
MVPVSPHSGVASTRRNLNDRIVGTLIQRNAGYRGPD